MWRLQLLQSEGFLLFSVLCLSWVNIFIFWSAGRTKQNIRIRHLTESSNIPPSTPLGIFQISWFSGVSGLSRFIKAASLVYNSVSSNTNMWIFTKSLLLFYLRLFTVCPCSSWIKDRNSWSVIWKSLVFYMSTSIKSSTRWRCLFKWRVLFNQQSKTQKDSVYSPRRWRKCHIKETGNRFFAMFALKITDNIIWK